MTGTGTGTDMYMYSMLPAVYSTGLYYSGWMISVVVCLRDAQPVSTKDRRISTIVLTAYHRLRLVAQVVRRRLFTLVTARPAEPL